MVGPMRGVDGVQALGVDVEGWTWQGLPHLAHTGAKLADASYWLAEHWLQYADADAITLTFYGYDPLVYDPDTGEVVGTDGYPDAVGRVRELPDGGGVVIVWEGC